MTQNIGLLKYKGTDNKIKYHSTTEILQRDVSFLSLKEVYPFIYYFGTLQSISNYYELK